MKLVYISKEPLSINYSALTTNFHILVSRGGRVVGNEPNNKILKGMHNILIMPNTTPIETAKVWGNFPKL